MKVPRIIAVNRVVATDEEGLDVHIQYQTPDGEVCSAVHYLTDNDPYGFSPALREYIAEHNPTIEPYVPPPGPTAEEQRALMQPLEKWRFDTIIDSRPGLRDKIETAIERNIPDLLQRATVRNKFRSVTQFSRLDPMFPFLASDPDINISDLEIDEMWRQGLALT